MDKKNNSVKIKQIALMGMFFALSMSFSFLESLIVIPGLPPGIKLGLSNLVTMYCLFFLGGKSAFSIVFLKSLFVFLVRGPVGATLSFSGGILSLSIMIIVDIVSRKKVSYTALSMFGAIFHNIGQLIAARFIINQFLLYYIPILLLSGVIMGILTGTMFSYLSPYLKKF